MPYSVRTEGDRHCIYNEETGITVPGGIHESHKDAMDHLSSLVALPEKLTRQEKVVARWVMTGLPDKQIAKALHVSERTVNSQVQSARAKLCAASRTELVFKMIIFGYVCLDDLASIHRDASGLRI